MYYKIGQHNNTAARLVRAHLDFCTSWVSRVVRGRTERAKTRRPSVTASAAERLADHERGRD